MALSSLTIVSLRRKQKEKNQVGNVIVVEHGKVPERFGCSYCNNRGPYATENGLDSRVYGTFSDDSVTEINAKRVCTWCTIFRTDFTGT